MLFNAHEIFDGTPTARQTSTSIGHRAHFVPVRLTGTAWLVLNGGLYSIGRSNRY
jgi:hypothetical protein